MLKRYMAYHKSKLPNGIRYLTEPNILRTTIYIVFVVLVISFIVLLLTYIIARNKLVEAEDQLMQLKVSESINLIDRQIDNIQSVLYMLGNDSNALKFGHYNALDKQSQINLALKIQQSIRYIKHSTPMLYDVYIHYPEQGLVLHDSGLYRQENFQTLSEQIRSSINPFGYKVLSLSVDDEYKVYIIRELPLEKGQGYVVATLDFGAVSNFLSEIPSFKDEKLLVVINNDVFMQVSSNSVDSKLSLTDIVRVSLKEGKHLLDGVPHYSVCKISPVTEWSYYLTVPYSEVLSLVRPLKVTVLSLLVFIVFYGILVSMAVSIRIYKPIEMLFQYVRGKTNVQQLKPDRIQFLNDSFERLLYDNDQLNNAVKRNIPMLRDKFLIQLMLQSGCDEESTLDHLQTLDVILTGSAMRVMVLSVRNISQRIDALDYIKAEKYKQYLDSVGNIEKVYTVQYEVYKYFMLINSNDCSLEHLTQTLIPALEEFEKNFRVKIHAGLSMQKASVTALNQAFIEASRAQEYQVMMGKSLLLCYEHMDVGRLGKLAYPFVAAEALQYAVSASDNASIIRDLADIRLFIENNMPPNEFLLKQVMMMLYGNLQQLLFSVNECTQEMHDKAQEVFSLLDECRTLEEYISILTDFALYISEIYSFKSAQHKQDILFQVRKYIEQNFAMPLNVQDIAQAVHVSEPYLYRLMREDMSVSPAKYINRMRIQHAARLLNSTCDNIVDISKACGFETKQAFYRHFKEYYNCRPSQYRKRHQEQN